MDSQTGNVVLGSPLYQIVHLNGASYRQIKLDHGIDQELFNCYQWRPPQGTGWKTKYSSSIGRVLEEQVDEDDDYEDEDGNEIESPSDRRIDVPIQGIKPGCFWEDLDNDDDGFNFVINFDQEKNSWGTIVQFPRALIGLLFGKKMSNLRQLETSTNTKIVVTPSGDDSIEVPVSLSSTVSRECVENALEKVLELASVEPRNPSPSQVSSSHSKEVWQKSNPTDIPPTKTLKQRFTHFIALPISQDNFTKQFNNLKTQILKNPDSYNVNSSLFQNSRRLHLTLFMLNIDSTEGINRCKTVFEQSQAAVYDSVDTRTVVLDFKGIEVMNDDEANAAVVVTRPSRSEKYEKINLFSGVLMENLVKSGLASWDQFHEQRCLASDGTTVDIKLHATLLNTKFGAKDQSIGAKRSIDVSKLVRDFKFITFGKVTFKEVHLLSLTEFESDNYKCIAQLKLP